MIEIVAPLLVGAAFLATLFFHRQEAAAWRAERAALTAAAERERTDLQNRIADAVEQSKTERTDLLNRLMSQDWGQYVVGRNQIQSAETPAEETPLLLTDADEAKWFAEAQKRRRTGGAAIADADALWHAENRRIHPEQYPDE